MNRIPVPLVLALLGALLSACGGGGPSPADPTPGPSAGVAAVPAGDPGRDPARDPVRIPIAALLADDGSAYPPGLEVVPADPAARTRAGRYASLAQAAQLERAAAGSIVRLSFPSAAAWGVDEGVGLVWATLEALHLPADAPVLVMAAEPRAAAALVNRLAEAGIRNTWLVMP